MRKTSLKTFRFLLSAGGCVFAIQALISSYAVALSPAERSKAQQYAELAEKEVRTTRTQDLAVQHINAALALDDTNSHFWSIKAGCLSTIGEDDEALKALDRAVKLDSHSAYIWSLRAEMLMPLHRRREALESIANALKNKPNPDDILRLSNAYTGLQMSLEARKLLDGLIKTFPDNEIFRSRRIVCATTLHDWNLVIADSNVVQKHGAQSFSRLKNLEFRANAYFQIKQYEKAMADYKSILRKIPDDRIAHKGLLDCYKSTGDKSAAMKEEVYLKGLDSDYRPM